MCQQIVNHIDWDCELSTNFSEVNLGCKARMASGLDWAFDLSEELIVLEDDCLPSDSFFEFCERLLDRYREDARVMMISGDNFQPARSPESYYFSRWPHIWGWASWRNRWASFDAEITSWPLVKATGNLRAAFSSDEEYEYWSTTLDRQHQGAIDTWDFPWAYAMWSQHGLSILPAINLVTNIGFGLDATHTTDAQSPLANRIAQEFSPRELQTLIPPQQMTPNYQADQFTWNSILAPPELRDLSTLNDLSTTAGQENASNGSDNRAAKKPKWYRRPWLTHRSNVADEAS